MTDHPLLSLYRAATAMAEPAAPWLLNRRVRHGKEDSSRLNERLGRPTRDRPAGKLVWIHGASVGESLSHLPLVERFRAERPDVTVLVTSGTRTSAELLASRLPPQAIHQYAPVDAPRAARRFIEHWRPDLAVFVESELWPNLIAEARGAGARLALLSARVSPASANGWSRAAGAARALLASFDLILPQDLFTAHWLGRLDVRADGRLDLKRLADPLPFDAGELERLRSEIGARKVLLAASTHGGEESLLGDIAVRLPGDPLLVVVPRHPERGEAAAVALEAAGLRTTRRALGEPPLQGGAYVADTLGELGLFYRLADAAVIGGSLLPGMTGHNPWEAARLAKPMVSGVHVQSFADAYAQLKAQGAVLMAGGPAELASALTALLTEPQVAAALGERALLACAAEREGFDAAFARLLELLGR